MRNDADWPRRQTTWPLAFRRLPHQSLNRQCSKMQTRSGDVVMGTVSKNLIDDLVSQIARLTSKVENLEAKVGDVSEFEGITNRLEDRMVQIAVSIDN